MAAIFKAHGKKEKNMLSKIFHKAEGCVIKF